MNNISLIVTVLNEENSIIKLLDSIKGQNLKPNEVVIVDGGSTDNTVEKIKIFLKKYPTLNIKVKIKKGNRSLGRNFAISLAKGNLIAITDAGCELGKDWLKELFAVYNKEKSPVVAGYYCAKSKTDFQKAVVPYALVMPDKVDENNFLPATRSMLIEKSVFKNLGGFYENLSDNEDYVFAKNIKNHKVKISFAKKAIVYWIPRKTLTDFYKMIFRFARGDLYAGIIRPKVILIFARYFIFLLLFILSTKYFLALLCFYCVWAIQKNKKYVGQGWKYLPVLQLSSDIAVMHGSVIGLVNRLLA